MVRSSRRALLAAACAVAATGTLSSTAQATCFSSTPSSQSFADSPADGEAGLAPEITAVTAAVDAACGLRIDPVLLGAAAPGDLIPDESVGVYMDTDGNPATGSALWEGADRVVITIGGPGPDLPPGLGTWNGSTFSFAGAPQLPALGAAGFVTDLNQLGVPGSTSIGISTISLWQGIFDDYTDFAPEVFASSFRMPVSFSTAAPAPVVAPAPGPVGSPPLGQVAGCRVPSLRGLTARSAARKLRSAGCSYRTKRVRRRSGHGRVVSSSPGAGVRTSRTVTVSVAKVSKKKRAKSSAARAYTAIEQALSAAERSRQSR